MPRQPLLTADEISQYKGKLSAMTGEEFVAEVTEKVSAGFFNPVYSRTDQEAQAAFEVANATGTSYLYQRGYNSARARYNLPVSQADLEAAAAPKSKDAA